MKRIYLVLIALVLLAVMILPVSVSAAPPATITVNFNQAQDQWRGSTAFGNWTPGYSYLADATSSDFVLTGNVLHTEWSYSPLVTDLSGQSTVYTYDKKAGLWIEKEGIVKYNYVPGYGDYTVENRFRGYLDFGGNTPSTANFVHGIAYQWVYLSAPQNAILTGSYTGNAVWDSRVNKWLVGFSIYRWDPAAPATALTFPVQFPEPIPADNYNPLGL
jgi:hypothetical protein